MACQCCTGNHFHINEELVFLEVLGLYGTPALIAIPAGFNVVTTQLAAFFENPVRVEVAAAFSMPMVGITIALLWVQRRLLARKSYVTVGGKGGHREPMALGAFRWVLFAYAMAIAGLSVFMPLFIILQTSFSKAWALPMSAANFTFHNFRITPVSIFRVEIKFFTINGCSRIVLNTYFGSIFPRF